MSLKSVDSFGVKITVIHWVISEEWTSESGLHNMSNRSTSSLKNLVENRCNHGMCWVGSGLY